MAYLPLDGPSLQDRAVVGDAVIVEAKIGSDPLVERKVITLQPVNGKIFIFFGYETTVPTAADVRNKGLFQIKGSKETYEASASQRVYLLSDSGNTDVIVIERA